MVESIEWFSVLILSYPLLQYFIVFLGAAFGGEIALFAFGFLAAGGILNIYSVIMFSFLGTLSSDILWFLLGRTVFFGKMISHRYANATVAVIAQALDQASKGNRLIALILAKFLVGTRIVVIMYISKNNLKLRHFVRHDAIAVLVWLLAVIPIGLFSGFGFVYISRVLKNIYAGIGFAILGLLVIIISQIWLKRSFTKKENDITKNIDL